MMNSWRHFLRRFGACGVAVWLWVVAVVGGVGVVGALPGCGAAGAGSQGRLVLIGGALEGTNEPVFKRMIGLARGDDGVARIVIATAASLNEAPAFESIAARFRVYEPGAELTTIGRETPPAEAVARINGARLAFFTGGDQKRIVDLYRKEGKDGIEAAALRSLLARGGTIAGTSAGDAMMSDPMFLTGGSDEALGMREGKGVQIGTGMGFLPGMIADSHFFERDRLGRLVAAMERSNMRWGIGVGEDAAVEVDLAPMTLTRLSERGVLLVDVADLRLAGFSRTGIRANPIPRGETVALGTYRRGSGAAFKLPSSDQLLRVERPARGVDAPAASWALFAGDSPIPRELVCGRHVVRAAPMGDIIATPGTWFGVEIFPAASPEQEAPQGE